MLWLRLFVGLTGAVALTAAVAASGCASQQESAEDASADYLGVQPAPEASEDEVGVDGGSGLATTLRLANMSPDLGPVDFCWRVYGATSFTGPVLGAPPPEPDGGGGDASSDGADGGALEGSTDGGGDGGTVSDARGDGLEDGAGDAPRDAPGDGPRDAPPDGAGDAPGTADADATAEAGDAAAEAGGLADGTAPAELGFGQVSDTIALPASGTFDFALVPPGQMSCSAPLFIGSVTLDAGKTATVVILGLASQDATAWALDLLSFVDEPTTPGVGAVRFIHAALGWRGGPPAPTLSVTAGGAVLAPEVAPGQATTPLLSPPVDALGYLDAPALPSPVPFEIDASGDAAPRTWTTGFLVPGVVPGTTHTGFVVSLAEGALGLVWCGDGLSPGVPGSCALLPAQ